MNKKIYSYRKILVTSAFPYSNGPIHLGHILENIQSDIWVRYHKLIGNIIYFISSDDSHGTPIMLKYMDKKINPKILIKKIIYEHIKYFKIYSIKHDFYNSTDNICNYRFLLKIYSILKKKKLIFEKYIYQFYDLKKFMFIPDRMIIGICPICKSNNQYGDNCNNCNNVYDAINLINPVSKITNTIPIIKKSKNIFFDLKKIEKKILFIIKNIIKLQKPILKKSLEWFYYGLKPWNISRDYPYFGFNIPNSNKYFYVWIDAIVGYISLFKEFCKLNNLFYKEYWEKNSNTELYHFIGKDIIYFHILFLPSLLYSINFRQPTKIFVHGHLKINNKKISKSSNINIDINYLSKNINTDYIRYYFASKLSNKITDINFNKYELANVINNNLIDNIMNLASRNSNLLNKYCNGKISDKLINISIYNYFISLSSIIWFHYENINYKKVINIINNLSKIANKYISIKKPWLYKKDIIKIQDICSVGIYLFKIIIIYLSPITPKIVKYVENFLNTKIDINNLNKFFKKNHKIKKFNIIFKKLDLKDLKNIY